MKKKNIRYQFKHWSLWKSWDYETNGKWSGGGTQGIFTFNPRFFYLWHVQWWGWFVWLQRKIK